MADTDVYVRFTGDTSDLASSITQARQALAAFAPGATGQAKSSLDALAAALRDGKAAADGAAGSWRDNLAVLADLTIVAGGAKAAVAGLFSGIGAVAKADFQADADAIHAIGAAAAGALADTKGMTDALIAFFAGAAYAERGSRLFEQANTGLRASIGQAIIAVQLYVERLELAYTATARNELAAISAAGGLDAFIASVNRTSGVGAAKDTLDDFTTQLMRIPGVTTDVAASIQVMFATIPNYSVQTNQYLVALTQEFSRTAEEAQATAKKLTDAFKDSANGGKVLGDLVGAQKNLEDIQVAAERLKASLSPGQASQFFDAIIAKLRQQVALGQAKAEQDQASLRATPLIGGALAAVNERLTGAVQLQHAFAAAVDVATANLQLQKNAADAITAALKQQADYEKLIDEDGSRVGRARQANENIKTLGSGATQGRGNGDADVGSDRDLLIRTLIGEAGGQGAEGMAAVANVIKNRVESAFDGMKTYRDVIAEGNGKQFNSYRDSDPSGQRARALGTDSPDYQKAAAIVDKLAAGNLDDNTNGATSFYNPKTATTPFAMTNQTQIGDHLFGNTKGSPKVRDGDEDDEHDEAAAKQLATLRQIDDEKRGGTETDLAQLEIAKQTAVGLHDQVAQAQALVLARQKDLADTAQAGDAGATRQATQAVAVAQEDLAKKTEAARKAQADLNVARMQPNSAGKLAAELAEYDAEETAARGNAAKVAELEKSKVEAQKAYDDQRKADAAATEDAVFANLQTKLKEQASLIQEQGKVGMLTQAEARGAQAANLAEQLTAEKAHYAALERIWGEGTTQYRKAAQQLLEVDQKNNAERQRATLLANTQVYDSYRQEFERIGSTVSSSLVGIIEGTSNFRTLMQNVAKQILSQFVDMGVKMVADWASRQAAQLVLTATGQAAQTSAVATGTAARETLSAAGLATTATATVTSVLGSIEASAAETFAGIFGFLSPVLGPAAAGPAAAGQAAVAAVAGSFAVGAWSLPNDMVAQVHAGEMIVPAGPAALMRAAAAGGGAAQGGGGAGGGGDLHTHFHVTAMDSRDVRRFFSDNSKHILGAINDGLRSGSHLGLSKLRSPVGV